jgi:putative membrane protein
MTGVAGAPDDGAGPTGASGPGTREGGGSGPGGSGSGPGGSGSGPGGSRAAPGGSGAAPGGTAGDAGAEPDARFTFANERTFLAWSRTALALVVAGLGIVQLLPPFPGVSFGRHLIGVPLIVLGALVAVTGYVEWVRNQRALRQGLPLPRSVLPVLLTATITAIGLLSGVVLLLSAIR